MGRLMNRKHGLLNFILLGLLATFTAAAIAMDASLLEMSEQLDGIEKQDFQAAIERATSCTRLRNFPCAESELAKAAKSANGGRDKKMLLASQAGLKNEKQQLANEIREAEEERQAQARRDEKEEQDRQARIRRDEQEAQAAEERQASHEANASVYASLQQSNSDIGALLAPITDLNNKFIAETAERERRASAERDRARAERNEHEAERRRDAERDRAAAQRTAQAQDRNEANTRNQREADAAKAQQARERQQDQARQQEQERQQSLVRQQEQVRQKAEAAAAKQAEQQAEKLAAEQYLRAMQNGIRLGVKNCYGQYEVGGNRPDIKPEVVSCIDVHYRARCEGSAVNYDGVHKNFTGFGAGCFGDTATISPKPACPANQVHVEVVAVRGCGG